jgi:PD-(D/E)XK endonuclease
MTTERLATDQKGAVAEAAIVLAGVRLGIGVFKPLSDGERYDLIVDPQPKLVRVQCKWPFDKGTSSSSEPQAAAARGMGSRIARHSPGGRRDRRVLRRNRSVFLLPIDRMISRSIIHLRLVAARNNHHRGIVWARDYELRATLHTRYGAIAQLGERRHGMAEVAGSSPAGSIAGRAPSTAPFASTR